MTARHAGAHRATTFPLAGKRMGSFLITCDRCPFRLVAALNRNRAYAVANAHSVDPTLSEHDALATVL